MKSTGAKVKEKVKAKVEKGIPSLRTSDASDSSDRGGAGAASEPMKVELHEGWDDGENEETRPNPRKERVIKTQQKGKTPSIKIVFGRKKG